MSETEMTLELNDFENNKTYNILVSSEDYERAISDDGFAYSLMLHARETANCTEQIDQPSTSGIQSQKTLLDSPPLPAEEETTCEEVPVNCPKNTNVWGYNNSVCLIKSMGNYYNDFNDPRKRKHIFENISNDLISHGFTADSKMVQNKWKSLIRSYNKAKDIKNRTGQGPSRFLFFEIIDDIVGNQPKNSCTHSINILTNDNEKENIIEVPNEFAEVNKNQQIEKIEEGQFSAGKKRKRCNDKDIHKGHITLKKEEYINRQKRHEERCALERERNEIEKRKLDILEKYLNDKRNKFPKSL